MSDKKETFCNAYSLVAWQMFKKTGNPYLVQECIKEEILQKELKDGKEK